MMPPFHVTPSATASETAATPPPRRRPTWLALLGVALVAGGAGVLAGTRLPSRSAPPPAPAGMPSMSAEPMPAAPAGAGSQAVYVSPARQQLVGVRSTPVARQQVEGTVRTVGTLAYDESRTAQIHTRPSPAEIRATPRASVVSTAAVAPSSA